VEIFNLKKEKILETPLKFLIKCVGVGNDYQVSKSVA